MSVVIGVSFTQQTCCMCGVVYALEDIYRSYKLEQKENGSTYCPNGHPWHFRGKALTDQITDLMLTVQARDNTLNEERSKRKRLEERIRKGVCLYCKRTFRNLAQHMKCKHPKK